MLREFYTTPCHLPPPGCAVTSCRYNQAKGTPAQRRQTALTGGRNEHDRIGPAREPACSRRRRTSSSRPTFPDMAAYQALCAEAERDYEGFWARLARENLIWQKPFTKVLDQSKAPVLQVVRRRRAERLLQLPRPPSQQRSRTRSPSFSRPMTARSPRSPTSSSITASASSPTASSPSASRPATASSSTCRCRSRRWWRCRPVRASARPTRSCSAASRPRACRSASSMPARSRSSPPTGRCAAARKSRSSPR